MKWLIFALGIVVGGIVAMATSIYLQAHRGGQDAIIFAAKTFYDGKELGYVAVTGTLTGPAIEHPNNTNSIACFQERKECIFSGVEQIGDGQIGRMNVATIFPIVKWDVNEIVAKDEPSATTCATMTITIDRKQQSMLWVQEQINETQPNCKNSDHKINKWTIEDSPGWKRMFEKK